MKTKLTLLAFVIFFSLFHTLSFAQEKKKELTETQKSARDLSKAFDKMHKSAVLKKQNFPCDVDRLVKGAYQLTPIFGFRNVITNIKNSMHRLNNNLDGILNKGLYSSNFDRIFDLFNNSKPYSEFVKDFTNKGIGDLSKKEDEILRQNYYALKAIYDYGITLNNDDDYNLEGCLENTILKMKLKKKKLGKVTWEIKTLMENDCKCEIASKSHGVKNLKFEYTAEVTGIFTTNKITFGEAKNINLKIISYECCKNLKEDASINAPENEEITLPDQTIGVNAGVGFSQDFEETSYCVGAEYLYNITDLGESDLFIGGNVAFGETSFMDFSSTLFSVGPTAQLFTPISHSGDTQTTNGISGSYLFGTNDYNGIKDDVSGFELSLNSGINVQLSKKVSLSLIIPIVTHQSLTYESQEGNSSYKTDDTTILINKNNPVKIGFRFRF